jgi:hypothetical protein
MEKLARDNHPSLLRKSIISFTAQALDFISSLGFAFPF